MFTKALFTLIVAIAFFNPALCKNSNDTIPKVQAFVITEFYYNKPETTINLKEEFVDKPSFIFIISKSDTSNLISIEKGSIDSILYFGMAKRMSNTIFTPTSDDAEFYYWSYVTGGQESNKGALIFKEYITGSLEKRGDKYYFFSIVLAPMHEFQIYARQVKL